MKKTKMTRSLLAACSIVALTAVMYGCVHDGDDAPATDGTDMTDPMEPTEPEPTEGEAAGKAATAAATAAMTASDNAAKYAKAAMDATATLATSQTNETARALAMEADAAATKAMAAYMDADKYAAAAAAATDTTGAVENRVKAEAAQKKAEMYAMTAMTKGKAAEEAAMGELMIVGTVKSVGDSEVDADGPRSEVTTGTGASAKTVITGLLSEPVTSGATTNGREAEDGHLTTIPDPYKSPRVNAASRGDVKIGKELDTADDAARLLIVTHYAGTKVVEVYDELAATDTNLHTRTDSDGTTAALQTAVPTAIADFDDGPVTLKTVGTYYRARTIPGDGSETDTAGLQAASPIDADSNPLTPLQQQGDMVGPKAEGVTVYSYTNAGVTTYLVEASRTVSDGVTTVSYQSVQIHVPVNRDGDLTTGLTTEQASTSARTDDAEGDELVEVTARIPMKAAYDHVHFGAWASLGAAKANGDQLPSGLGIGFVQSIGDGMTGADMPNNGTATYSGNWVATIQEADTDGDGEFSLTVGPATVAANFAKETVKATLISLATLEGAISGNAFSGIKATATGGGLNTEGTFDGSFSGGFYGAKADETAGVFSFTSAGDTAGGFAGAFGGQRDPEE